MDAIRHHDHLHEGSALPAPAPPDRLVLTVDEAAYLLDISRGLAYELVARGELPAIRLGRRIVIPRVAMEELLGTSIH
jgi:excisionase family DNA binding protein